LLSFQATERITYGLAMPNHVFFPRKKIEDISIGTTTDGARSVLCCGKNNCVMYVTTSFCSLWFLMGVESLKVLQLSLSLPSLFALNLID
jgi:hypothetical protein